jgi:DNA (cytosine-5)-methyltransferase 1
VDTTQTITHLGLCAGYGGIELGLKRIFHALRTVALCEIEGFAIANLVAKMEAGLLDAAPIWSDLKTFPWKEFSGKVDILTGGYPCQPFSAAGKRLGQNDPRHLWPRIATGISLVRPALVFIENVDGHVSLGLREVIEELAELGYKTTWGIFSASEVGAPHQRKRVFILAHRNGTRLEGWYSTVMRGSASELLARSGSPSIWPSRPNETQYNWEPPRVVGDTNSERPQKRTGARGAGIQGTYADGRADADRETQSSMGGDVNGTPSGMDYAELCISCDNRTDELRLLGNGVVPSTVKRAFLILAKQLDLL